MIPLPFGLSLDVASLVSVATLGVIAGWVGCFLAFRKDERAVQVKQVTEERTKWRDAMRTTVEAIARAYVENKIEPFTEMVAVLRARLVTSINPKDAHDREILDHFDALFSGGKSDFDVFSTRIALLLKHDWERVKWDCLPIYFKCAYLLTFFLPCSWKHLRWCKRDYRDL